MSYLEQLEPLGEFNRLLQSNVHPVDWKNPTPTGRYNIVVVGAGTAGLVTAAGAAGMGAKVALIERGLMGGDCLNVGCVPSKAVISAARRAAACRDSAPFGVSTSDVQVDFAAVMERMRRLRASISPHDSAKRFTELGIDVFMGQGCFTGTDRIEVAGATLEFKKAVIATGARAAELQIPGLQETGYINNETMFSLTELPRRLLVIGGGPVGCEMAQSFARLGSHVTQIEKSEHILAREETDAAMIVQNALRRDGIDLRLNAKVLRAEGSDTGKVLIIEQAGEEIRLEGDEILVSIGRTPNLEGLGLDSAQVQSDARLGVVVDDRLRTTNPKVFAAGDVASKYKFTHAADFLARIVIQNALFMGRARASRLIVPWCTYTEPEIAHVGMYPQEANANGIELSSFTQQLESLDRAILDDETEGFVRAYTRKGSDKIVGATVVAPRAGDMIGEITLAMKNGLGLSKIASTIHPYPTQHEAIRRLGDQYNRTRLTPWLKTAFSSWLKWTR